MPITITSSKIGERDILTATGIAANLDELWLALSDANKVGSAGNLYVLTGNVSLILNCTLSETRTGYRFIVLRNRSSIVQGEAGVLTLEKLEFVGESVTTTGKVFVVSEATTPISSPVIQAGYVAPLTTPELITALFLAEVEEGWNFARLLRLFAAVLGGKIKPDNDQNQTIFRNVADTADAVISVADAQSDRSTVTYNIPQISVTQDALYKGIIYSDTIPIPNTLANTDVTITSSVIRQIVDIKYLFPPALNNNIRVNKAEILGNKITLNFSLDCNLAQIIVIGNL